MRSLHRAFLLVTALGLISMVAGAADGGLDSGVDADTDASSLDASIDAESDAAPEAGATDGGAGDATTPPSDSGPITTRPDGANDVPDAGSEAGPSGGCSCVQAGGPESNSLLGGAGPAMACVVLGIALATARRRRRPL